MEASGAVPEQHSDQKAEPESNDSCPVDADGTETAMTHVISNDVLDTEKPEVSELLQKLCSWAVVSMLNFHPRKEGMPPTLVFKTEEDVISGAGRPTRTCHA